MRACGILLLLLAVFFPISQSQSTRNALQWPFNNISIWNLPIGADAQYVPATIKQAQAMGMTVDQDIIVLTPNETVMNVYFNDDGWTGRNRCLAEGGVLFSTPWPKNYYIPGANGSDTPNNGGAMLASDGRTLQQSQPMTRCNTTDAVITSWIVFPSYDIYNDDGTQGAHGGSGLSAIGGTIRLGELVPGAPNIRHALKVNLDASENYYNVAPYFRWPAVTADSYAPSVYGGTNPAVGPGSLLALSTALDIDKMGFETTPAKMLAWTFQNFGAYIVDDTNWDVYCIEVEQGPNGKVTDEFQSVWGFPIETSDKNSPWGRDMDRIFLNLSVVNNWDKNVYQDVIQSNGKLGAGGGAALQPWAPPFA